MLLLAIVHVASFQVAVPVPDAAAVHSIVHDSTPELPDTVRDPITVELAAASCTVRFSMTSVGSGRSDRRRGCTQWRRRP